MTRPVLYLASRSKARRQILARLGIRFKVLAATTQEKMPRRAASYPALVIHNARAKARAASARVRSGVVIAADTVCVHKGRIFGKPRDLRQAARMLKTLSRAPQWLYTGVCVRDAATGRELTACEKTRVLMDPLTDAQIKRYFARVSPLDKAGSFDIQGRGALFIRRIEGCYYNVVGLPVRTLFRLLGRMGVGLLCAALLALGTAGCSHEYNVVTKQEEAYFYSTDREVQLGVALDREVMREYKLDEDPLVQKRVEDLGARIVAVCDRRDIDYHFKVIKDDEVNAVSFPGGYVYVFSGLIEKAKNDDELAGVLAHEVGHIVARHSIKKLQAMQGYSLLRLLAIATPEPGAVGVSADAVFAQLFSAYSVEDEFLADQLGARYLKRAGLNPRAMITFLYTLHEVDRRKAPQPRSYFKTHPFSPDRIRAVKEELGEKMNFDDYINIEDSPRR